MLRGVEDADETPLSIPLHTLLPDAAETIEMTFGRFSEWTPTDTGLFETVKSRFYVNMCRASNQVPYEGASPAAGRPDQVQPPTRRDD